MTHDVKLIATTTLLAGGTDVLLVKYNDMPDNQRGWFLPHDLLGKFEHPADAAARALREQLGFAAPMLRLKHVESFKGRDGTWHMPFHFLAELAERPAIQPSAALAAAEWFALDKLPPRSESRITAGRSTRSRPSGPRYSRERDSVRGVLRFAFFIACFSFFIGVSNEK